MTKLGNSYKFQDNNYHEKKPLLKLYAVSWGDRNQSPRCTKQNRYPSPNVGPDYHIYIYIPDALLQTTLFLLKLIPSITYQVCNRYSLVDCLFPEMYSYIKSQRWKIYPKLFFANGFIWIDLLGVGPLLVHKPGTREPFPQVGPRHGR